MLKARMYETKYWKMSYLHSIAEEIPWQENTDSKKVENTIYYHPPAIFKTKSCDVSKLHA